MTRRAEATDSFTPFVFACVAPPVTRCTREAATSRRRPRRATEGERSRFVPVDASARGSRGVLRREAHALRHRSGHRLRRLAGRDAHVRDRGGSAGLGRKDPRRSPPPRLAIGVSQNFEVRTSKLPFISWSL